jgi:hypothetical protein
VSKNSCEAELFPCRDVLKFFAPDKENMITFNLKQSTAHNGLLLTSEGKPVSLEEAFQQGFFIKPEDANIVLTLLTTWITNRDHAQI